MASEDNNNNNNGGNNPHHNHNSRGGNAKPNHGLSPPTLSSSSRSLLDENSPLVQAMRARHQVHLDATQTTTPTELLRRIQQHSYYGQQPQQQQRSIWGRHHRYHQYHGTGGGEGAMLQILDDAIALIEGVRSTTSTPLQGQGAAESGSPSSTSTGTVPPSINSTNPIHHSRNRQGHHNQHTNNMDNHTKQ